MSALCTWGSLPTHHSFLPSCSSPSESTFKTPFTVNVQNSFYSYSYSYTPHLDLDSTRHTPHLVKMAESGSSMIRDLCHPHCNGEAGFGSANADYAEIILLRHGETAWNSERKCQGQLDVELNDAGRQQAAAVADQLSREPKIYAAYSSDLRRALETAQIIAKSCGGVEVIEDQNLRERHLGDLQGVLYNELAKVSPKAYQAFVSHRTDQEIPGGGESSDQFNQRCTSAVQRIGQKHKGERVVVVTHGAVLEALYRRASPNGRPGGVQNTSVNIFHLSDGDQWIIKKWGDVSHLDTTGFLKSGVGGEKNFG